jgi:hypothetical protein
VDVHNMPRRPAIEADKEWATFEMPLITCRSILADVASDMSPQGPAAACACLLGSRIPAEG